MLDVHLLNKLRKQHHRLPFTVCFSPLLKSYLVTPNSFFHHQKTKLDFQTIFLYTRANFKS